MPNNNERENTIDRMLELHPSGKRTCENIGIASIHGGCGCILFEQNNEQVDVNALANTLNALARRKVAESTGTCKATGATVTNGAVCGIGDKMFRIGARNLLEGKA